MMMQQQINTIYSRSIAFMLVILWSCLLQRQKNVCAAARPPINSYQLAVGEWDVKIRSSRYYWKRMDLLSTTIFPSLRNNENQKSMPSKAERRKLFGTTTLDCSLSLGEDGTFVLSPQIRGGKNNKENQNTKTIMPLRGQWMLQPNPYCVTDRYYDELILKPYPRQRTISTKRTNHLHHKSNRGHRKERQSKNSRAEDVSSTKTKQQMRQQHDIIEYTLYCRMWGRYSRRKKKNMNDNDDYCCGKMTHGTLVMNRKQKQAEQEEGKSFWYNNINFFRPIVGSFSAERKEKDPSHIGWIDKEHFGY